MTTPDERIKRINDLLRQVHQIRMAIWAAEWANGKHEDAPPPPTMKGMDEERNNETFGNCS